MQNTDLKNKTFQKVIIAGYRSWAINVFKSLKERFESKQIRLYLAENPHQLKILRKNHREALICLVGWSWIVHPIVCEKRYVVCLHPSDLPNYSGGSPIQHQIIDGIVDTKMTLFKVDSKLDEGDIISKCDLDLRGKLTDIFERMTLASSFLLEKFINQYPDVELTPQKNETALHKRRLQPHDSKLEIKFLKNQNQMSVEDLYNFIRCREDPYPNVFIEDENGKLLFKSVEYIEK